MNTRMDTWMIVAIVAVVAVLAYFLLRKKSVALPDSRAYRTTDPIVLPIPSAPGVSPTTGEVRPNPPPAPPPDVKAAIRSSSPPRGVLENVPIVGTAHKAAMRPVNMITNTVNSSLEHIPVVGKALAAPGKAVGKILSVF